MASKAARPKNALAHGLYASDLVLAWENEQDFVDLHESVRQELNPVGSLEDIAVLDIARLHWVKRRLNIGAQLVYHRHPDAAAITKAGEEGWQGVRNYLSVAAAKGETAVTQVQALARAQFDTAKTVLALIRKKTDEMDQAPQHRSRARQIRHSEEYDLVETASADVEALLKLGESLDSFGGKIADLMRQAANFDLEQGFFERAYRPDVVERTAKVEVQIDRQIEKAIARLANIKEFKRIYALRTVEGKRVDAIKAPSPPSSDAADD